MSNDYYNETGAPSTRSQGASASMRAEFALIAAGFGKLPTMTGNGDKIIAVNAGGTALTPLTTTGSGNGVRATSPTLVTPVLGVATATSINKVAFTQPANSATLTLADGKTVTVSNTLTFAGTDGSTLNIGAGGSLGTGAFATIANYAPLNNPTFTGTPAAPTAAVDTNSTQIATTAFVIGQGYLKSTTAAGTYAPLASPTFSGTAAANAWSNLGTVATADINGGTVDGTTIGGSTPAAGTFTTLADSKGSVRSIPQNAQAGSYTLVVGDAGKHVANTTTGWTVPQNVFSAGDAITLYNNSGGNLTVTQGVGVTLRSAGSSATGNRTLAQRGICTVLCVASNEFVISGAGIT